MPSLAFISNIFIAAICSRGGVSGSLTISTRVRTYSLIVNSFASNARPISPGIKNEEIAASPPTRSSRFSFFSIAVLGLTLFLRPP